MRPKVSIIIPIYNVAEYVDASIEAAFNQSYKDIEYIIIDDCGSDNSMARVNQLINSDAYKDKVVKIIHQEYNKGVSVARNTGVANATGEYLFFMDSDDIITPTCIESHVNAIIVSKADYTIGGVDVVGAKSLHVKKSKHQIYDDAILGSYLNGEWDSGPWNKLISKNYILNKRIAFTEGIRYEDMLWGYQMAKSATKVEQLSDVTYQYIIHGGSFVTSKNSYSKIIDLITVINTINADVVREEFVDAKNHYVSFWKFNAALLLLHFEGTNKQRKDLYNRIQQIRSKYGVYNLLLSLPFWAFFSIVFLPYTLYKSLQ